MKTGDDFELKRALDALPRSIEPPADVWPEVNAKITARRPRPGDGLVAWAERFEPRQIRIAAGIGIIGIGMTFLALTTRANARWIASPGMAEWGSSGLNHVTLAGEPLLLPNRRFWKGSALTTNGHAEARVQVGSIGTLKIYPNSSMRLVEARAASHRMALDYGMIYARIDAPPRLFVVETPSGTAIDLGCEYTLHVDSLGQSVLHVRLGWVEFENAHRESLVPAGFMVISRPGTVGIPVRENAGNQVRWAVTALEQSTSGARADSAVRVLETYAGRYDAVTLWHVLPRVTGAERERTFDALARRAPPPPQVTRQGALALDPIMLRLWWEALPGTLPITPSWTRRLWLMWLKAASWL